MTSGYKNVLIVAAGRGGFWEGIFGDVASTPRLWVISGRDAVATPDPEYHGYVHRANGEIIWRDLLRYSTSYEEDPGRRYNVPVPIPASECDPIFGRANAFALFEGAGL